MGSLFPNIGGDVKKNVQKLFGWTVLGVDEFGRAGDPKRRWRSAPACQAGVGTGCDGAAAGDVEMSRG